MSLLQESTYSGCLDEVVHVELRLRGGGLWKYERSQQVKKGKRRTVEPV